MEETLNGSITESTSVSSAGAENGENSSADDSNPFAGGGASGFGGGVLGDPLAPDEGYEYDFGGDSGLPMQTPFDQLLEFEEFDNLGDIFGDLDPSDNPFAGGGTPSGVTPSSGGDGQPSAIGDNAPEGNSNNPFDSFNPNTDGSPFTDSDDVEYETVDGVEEMSSGGGGSMMNADFSGIDTGAGNTDNGNGNNFVGDSEGESGSNNQADGNGNWFYGNDNQAEGNGNWNFGDGNQVNGNGNWNLNEESGTPFNSILEGENNPLTGGNPQGAGEEGGIPADALGSNNPIFAGGGTTPVTVGEGETPDTAENPTGNQNTVNGNGNWNFGSNNNTSGNGNWNFGDGNVVTNGNGNRNSGDNNEVSGNGNRPSGDDNSISGNSNSVAGDGNSINGNRFDLEEDGLDIVGNADRYFIEDEDGNVTLVSDESAGDLNYTFDYSGVAGASADNEVDEYEAPKDIKDEAPEDMKYEMPKDMKYEMPKDMKGEEPEDMKYEMPKDMKGEEPEDMKYEMPEDMKGEEPEDMEYEAPEDMKGEAPNSNTNSDYDFSAFEQTDAGGESSMMGGSSSAGGEGDPNELIRQSPFGVLLDIPGIDGAEDIFGNVGGAGGENPFGGGSDAGGESPMIGGSSMMGGDSAGGGNPLGDGSGAGGAGSSNPFANFNPLEEGNPFVEGDEPNVSFGGGAGGFGGADGADSEGGGSPFGGGAGGFSGGAGGFGGGAGGADSEGGGSPFGSGAGGGNPFGGASSGLPEEGSFAIGDSDGYVVRDENGEWFFSEDDVASDDDTALSNPVIPGVDGGESAGNPFGGGADGAAGSESEGNPFGGNPFEFNPTADSSDSSDVPAGNTFPVGEVPEGLSNEELAVSSEVAEGEEISGGDSNPFADSGVEFEYSWNFDSPDSGSFYEDSSSSDSDAPEVGNENPLFSETDFENPFAGDGENINPSEGAASAFNPETSQIELPNGATINPFNSDGESDLSIDTPIVNEDGLMVGELNIAFPEYIEEYFSSVFNLDEVQEFNSDGGFDFSDMEASSNLFGAGSPVLGEDKVLQLPGGFEFDLSGIIGDPGDSGDSAI